MLTGIFMVVASMACFAAPQAADMSLRSIEGEAVNLTQKKGKVVVLAFCATWVPQADKRLPAFQRLAELYSTRGAEFYWVSINSAQEIMHQTANSAPLRNRTVCG